MWHDWYTQFGLDAADHGVRFTLEQMAPTIDAKPWNAAYERRRVHAALGKDHPGRMSHHAGDRPAHGVYAHGEREEPDDGPRVDTPRGPRME